MKKSKTIKTIVAVLTVAACAMLAGCGGGGGGGAAVPGTGKGTMKLSIAIPRHVARSASSYTYSDSGSMGALLNVLQYSSTGAASSVAGDTNISFGFSCSGNSESEESCSVSGSPIFFIQNIPVGANYILKGSLTASYTSSETYTARQSNRSADATTTWSGTEKTYYGALVESIADGKTTNVNLGATSTVVALAALRYSLTRIPPAAPATAVTSSVKTAIEGAVNRIAASYSGTYDSYVSQFECIHNTANVSTCAAITNQTSCSANSACAWESYTSDSSSGGYCVATCVDPFNTSNWNSSTIVGPTSGPSITTELDAILAEAGIGADTTAPQVSSFSPADGATNVTYNSTVFKVIFNESMDSSVNLNNQSTLDASGFSISLRNNSTLAAATINAANALSYGTFSWMTTTFTNDTLAFTLKSNSVLSAAGLFVMNPATTYAITSRTVPTGLKDVAGNALSTTGIASTGSFTTSSGPQVSSFYPTAGSSGVTYDGAVFKVIFTESMDSSVNLNNQSTLNASGFSITIRNDSSLVSTTINASNALSYGTFSWTTTSYSNDTLAFTLKSNSTLSGAGLFTLKPSTSYTITSRTVPTNLQSAGGLYLNTAGIASTGTFTTTSGPQVSSYYPANGAVNVPYNGTAFKIIFSESMNSSVNLNNQTTLNASGFGITINSITINASNALSYGTFSWTTTSYSNDTLVFTLKSNATLAASELAYLSPGTTYTISARTPPTNVTNTSGLALNTSNPVASTGSFTTIADTTAPQVSGFYPISGATNVPNNSPVFKVIFNESMDSSVNLNNQSTLTASSFSIELRRDSTLVTFVIDYTNALSYGTFSWGATTFPNDTLQFTLKSNSTLAAAGLHTIRAGETYTILQRTVPNGLKDAAGNALSTTGIASTGSFTTAP